MNYELPMEGPHRRPKCGEDPAKREGAQAALIEARREHDAARVEVEELRDYLARLLAYAAPMTPTDLVWTLLEQARALLARPSTVAALRAREALAALEWVEAQPPRASCLRCVVKEKDCGCGRWEQDRRAAAGEGATRATYYAAREAREKAERAEETKP